MDILQRITDLRLERQWTEYRLAEESGIPQSTISSWYKKKILPTIPSLKRICDAYHITLAQFFSENNDPIILTDKQKEFFNTWNRLNEKQQESLLDFLKTI